MNDNKVEYVYCMSNKSFCDDLVKIGWTTNKPTLRAQQLYTTGVPTPFKIEFIIKTPDGRSLESRLHSYFSPQRENNAREFFNINVQELRKILTDEFKLTLTDPEPEPEPEYVYQNYCYTQPYKGFERCSKKTFEHFNELKGTNTIVQEFKDIDLGSDLNAMFEKFRYNP